MSEQRIIEGMVNSVTFTNEDTGFTVCDIDSDGILITAVGTMPGLSAGEYVRLCGNIVMHPNYGEQLKVTSFEKTSPAGEAQILVYLSSGIIKGIGPSTAVKIVNMFGDESLDVIRDDPDRLAEVKGISRAKALAMQESYLLNQSVQNIVMFLAPFGVTPALAVKVYKHFGLTSVSQIQKDPYVLCDVNGIGFRTADKIARQMNADLQSESRIAGGIKYILTAYAQNGNTCMEKEYLVNTSADFLQVDITAIENTLLSMILRAQIISDVHGSTDVIFLPYLYNAELGVARRLYNLQREEHITLKNNFDHYIEKAEEQSGITLSDTQRAACLCAAQNGSVIITGGPGTGKTTIINTIISIMNHAGLRVALCAPTGRAAKRLSETCGTEAKTIHRLLEINFAEDEEKQTFSRCETNPLDEDVIIVDEMSMVDILMMNGLLRALKPGARLVMAGDADQLPSVGAGNVLRDIIECGFIPTCRLTEIYRQAAESMIIVNAHRINGGENPVTGDKNSDFFFMHKTNGTDIQSSLVDVVCRRLPAAYGFDPFTDIQVLTPSRKSMLGVTELNKRLQEELNPPSKNKNQKQIGEIIYRQGDKIMQTRNNYDVTWVNINTNEVGFGAFNGDIGIIQKIDEHNKIVDVLFDGERIVTYSFDELEQTEPAYAVTVHKSQGSEFDAVVIPMFPAPPQLMNRNLLYTALTRAKKLVVLIGREEVLYRMIQNDSRAKRFSGLKYKIDRLAE
ncbi:MAG: ATP-dependent RecD-like DNA helicase [Clostridia bacterium]|nr:ATP-dependent RecD-like DNA helicase [Clostridia bacterium]